MAIVPDVLRRNFSVVLTFFYVLLYLDYSLSYWECFLSVLSFLCTAVYWYFNRSFSWRHLVLRPSSERIFKNEHSFILLIGSGFFLFMNNCSFSLTFLRILCSIFPLHKAIIPYPRTPDHWFWFHTGLTRSSLWATPFPPGNHSPSFPLPWKVRPTRSRSTCPDESSDTTPTAGQTDTKARRTCPEKANGIRESSRDDELGNVTVVRVPS